MTIDKESLRPVFERWFLSTYGELAGARNRDGWYIEEATEFQWVAWQGAFESLGEPVAYENVRAIAKVPGQASATRITTKSIPLYRLPETQP